MPGEDAHRPLRIALLVTDLERGGTPLRIRRIAQALHERGVDVHVGCLAPPGPVSHALGDAGIPTFACDARSARDIGALFRLRRRIRALRPDLIHATLTHANVAARLVGLLTGVPVVTSTATIEVERRWHRTAERLTRALDRGHIVNSRALLEHVVAAFGRRRDRVYRLPPLLSRRIQPRDRAAARRALALPADAFVVAWLGRFDPVKRLDVLLQCAAELTDIRAHFLLAGDGPLRPMIAEQLRTGPAADRVQLLGWQEDPARVLSAADALLFPSLTEGMPNAVLEALACGVPVVAHDIAALRELAAAGDAIVLVSTGQPAAYADALRALHADPADRARRGRAARQWADAHLDPVATIGALLEVYRRVLGR